MYGASAMISSRVLFKHPCIFCSGAKRNRPTTSRDVRSSLGNRISVLFLLLPCPHRATSSRNIQAESPPALVLTNNQHTLTNRDPHPVASASGGLTAPPISTSHVWSLGRRDYPRCPSRFLARACFPERPRGGDCYRTYIVYLSWPLCGG